MRTADVEVRVPEPHHVAEARPVDVGVVLPGDDEGVAVSIGLLSVGLTGFGLCVCVSICVCTCIMGCNTHTRAPSYFRPYHLPTHART